jgi:deazaflavin-dependent oxidoreductase (nitroreductase family)
VPEPQAHHPPGWFTRNVFNPFVGWLARRGVSIAGSQELEVMGRKTGKPRRTPVNPLDFDGGRYLVAPRGEVQWVKNVRANPSAKLIKGGETEEIMLSEVVEDAERVPLIRAYLEKWRWETGVFFDGVKADAPDEELARIAPDHPAFRISD